MAYQCTKGACDHTHHCTKGVFSEKRVKQRNGRYGRLVAQLHLAYQEPLLVCRRRAFLLPPTRLHRGEEALFLRRGRPLLGLLLVLVLLGRSKEPLLFKLPGDSLALPFVGRGARRGVCGCGCLGWAVAAALLGRAGGGKHIIRPTLRHGNDWVYVKRGLRCVHAQWAGLCVRAWMFCGRSVCDRCGTCLSVRLIRCESPRTGAVCVRWFEAWCAAVSRRWNRLSCVYRRVLPLAVVSRLQTPLTTIE